MAELNGICDPRFERVYDALATNIRSGKEVGASICVTIGGEPVIDLWGGWREKEHLHPWTADTIVNVFSATKTVASLAVLMLHDRGDLDLFAPVAKYWPEFAQNGKSAVTVAQLMAHSSGLSGWKEPLSKADLYDWDKVTTLLAAQAPFWEPGTAPGYHALTQGYLVGEVVRRITGRSLGTVFREEIAEPLGADFHIGLPASEDARVAELIPPPRGGAIGDGPMSELTANMSNNPGIDVRETRTRAWRGAEIPAAGGQGNARSIARVHSILANGGEVDGRRYLSEAGCRRALELQVEGQDLVLNTPARFGLGFGLAGGVLPTPNASVLYWGGYGGSLAVIDMENRAAFGYAMNRMESTTTGDVRGVGLVMGMWGALAG